ncbi:MAG: DUF424 domain-containing protein [Candidatus Helarchaeota archaeon]
MAIYMRIRNMQDELMVSICDQECLGKTYREGKLVLKVTPQFYGETLVSLEKAITELKKATIANLVGETIITECIKCGLIHKKGIIRIEGIPHAQIIKM